MGWQSELAFQSEVFNWEPSGKNPHTWQAARGGMKATEQDTVSERKKDPGIPADTRLLEPKIQDRYSFQNCVSGESRCNKYTTEKLSYISADQYHAHLRCVGTFELFQKSVSQEDWVYKWKELYKLQQTISKNGLSSPKGND